MGTTYFLDTYALIEILNKNRNYESYKKGNFITTKLNLMEFHYYLLRNVGKKDADFYYDAFLGLIIEFTDEIIKIANDFKLLNKIRKLSYIDCVGYITAKINNSKFLTGDNQFKDLENVEFIK